MSQPNAIHLNTSKHTFWILGGIMLLALLLRVDALKNGFEFVEETIMNEAAWPLSQISQEIYPDQAPLKYYFLHAALNFGRSEFLLRFPSIFFDLLSIWVMFYLGRILFDRKAALLACFFMAVSMWNIHHATLARNYPLYAFSALLSTYFLYRATRTEKLRDWVFYALAQAFSFYSFYPSVFVLAAQLGWFFMCYGRRWDLIKRLFLSLALYFAAIIPLLFAASEAFNYRINFRTGFEGLENIFQISQALLEHFGGMRGPVPAGLVVFLLAFASLLFFRGKKQQTLLVTLILVVPITLYVVCFYFFKISIFPRIFFSAYPFFILLVSAGIMSWRHGITRVIGGLFFILPFLIYVFFPKSPMGFMFPSDYQRKWFDASAVAAAIEKRYTAETFDYIAVAPWSILFFIQFHLGRDGEPPASRYFKNSTVAKHLKRSGEVFTMRVNPKPTIYGVDGYLSILKPLAAAGRLLVVDVVSGNLATLPHGAETMSWLKTTADRIEHEAGADFYFIGRLSNQEHAESAQEAQRRLLQDSSNIDKPRINWGKRKRGLDRLSPGDF